MLCSKVNVKLRKIQQQKQQQQQQQNEQQQQKRQHQQEQKQQQQQQEKCKIIFSKEGRVEPYKLRELLSC